MRATLLPTPGDPFLISYWLQNFRAWSSHAGRLYVQISWPQPLEVLERVAADIAAAAPDAVILLPPADGYLDHGQAMHRLLDACSEDTVCFMEDDLYVRHPGYIDACFRTIETRAADAVGSARGSMSMELVDAAGHHTPGLWPHLLFAAAETLREIEEPFGARIWQAGETVTGLDHVCQELCSADTFCAAAMELRGRAHVELIESPGAYLSAPVAATIHIGSLSSGPLDHPVRACRPQESGWGPRVCWWRRCARAWPGGLTDLHTAYTAAVEALAALQPYEVDAAAAMLEKHVNW